MITKNSLQKFLDGFDSEKSLCDEFNETALIEGEKYTFNIVSGSSEDWEVEDSAGKYQSTECIYQLVKINDEYEEIEKYELYVSEHGSRTGSYYTDWYYTYDREIVNKFITHIPEATVIIPAYEKVEYK